MWSVLVVQSEGGGCPCLPGRHWRRKTAVSGSSRQLTLKIGTPWDQVWDLLWVQLASYLEGGPLMWMMPLHLYVHQKSMMVWWSRVFIVCKFSCLVRIHLLALMMSFLMSKHTKIRSTFYTFTTLSGQSIIMPKIIRVFSYRKYILKIWENEFRSIQVCFFSKQLMFTQGTNISILTIPYIQSPLWSEKGTHSYKNALIGPNHFTLITFNTINVHI